MTGPASARSIERIRNTRLGPHGQLGAANDPTLKSGAENRDGTSGVEFGAAAGGDYQVLTEPPAAGGGHGVAGAFRLAQHTDRDHHHHGHLLTTR